MSEDRLQTREAMLFQLQAEKHNHRVDNEYLIGRINELHSENERLRAALKDICDLAEENSQYKGEFLAKKHGDAEEIAKVRALIAAE